MKNCKPTVMKGFMGFYNKFLLKYGHIEQKDDMAPELNEMKANYYL